MPNVWKGRYFAASLLIATACAAATAGVQTTRKGTAVVYPVLFKRNSGSDTSRATAIQAIGEVLQKSGYTLASGDVAASTWKQFRFPFPTSDSPPTTDELSKLGKAVKAKYVVYATFDFNSRSIWVTTGPKTISTVTTGITIVNSSTQKVVYHKKNVQARSDEKEKVVKVVAAVLITPLVTAVSGGPKTPQEQRAAQLSVGEALLPWVNRH
jgi:hypothetical protein